MRIIAAIHPPEAIRRILDRLGAGLIRRAWTLEADITRNHDSILAQGQPSGVDCLDC